jgi:hypothetical protein
MGPVKILACVAHEEGFQVLRNFVKMEIVPTAPLQNRSKVRLLGASRSKSGSLSVWTGTDPELLGPSGGVLTLNLTRHCHSLVFPAGACATNPPPHRPQTLNTP